MTFPDKWLAMIDGMSRAQSAIAARAIDNFTPDPKDPLGTLAELQALIHGIENEPLTPMQIELLIAKFEPFGPTDGDEFDFDGEPAEPTVLVKRLMATCYVMLSKQRKLPRDLLLHTHQLAQDPWWSGPAR